MKQGDEKTKDKFHMARKTKFSDFPLLKYDGPPIPIEEMGFQDAVSLGRLKRMTATERHEFLGPPADEPHQSLKETPMKSHYNDPATAQIIERRTYAIIVDNEPGVLARIAGMFSGRGYNIESLTVTETEHEKHISRLTIITKGTAAVLDQIKAQLERLVPVHRVMDLTTSGPSIERELALVKVRGKGEQRMEALRLATAFGAKPVDATLESFVFEITGSSEDVERFINLMAAIGLVEVSRTGVAAISRGADGL
jgi:acetolactate synthase I/III small subunit